MSRKILLGMALAGISGCGYSVDEISRNIILPEQRTITYREPDQYLPVAIPSNVAPRTVSNPRPETKEWQLSLDDAIRIALENARVIRVLAGTAAVSTGTTIYDAAITNTTIDQAQAVFDPTLKWDSILNHTNSPIAVFDPFDPQRSLITGTSTDRYSSLFGLSKTNEIGGKWSVDWSETPSRFNTTGPFPLNPERPSSVTLSYTQPLLLGGGFSVNTAPIVIARLNTEQSFFQYKNNVQQLVRGTIEAYWNLVQARVNVWARKIQEQQSKEAFDREAARLKTGFTDLGTLSQTRVTYNQFRSNRIAAEADVLAREGALRNLLGLEPNDDRQIVPTSAPSSQRLPHNWDELVRVAEQRRPDLVELKIIVEADQVRLTQAENLALPQLNAVSLYRWNGLQGEMPNGEDINSASGKYGDWSVGINFSVPLGLRQGRAQVRQQKLLILRDQANVEQQLHLAIHQLASTVRELDSAYEQYLAYKETREAADSNLKVQNEKFKNGQTIYLNVLLALNDWGNAISSEAQQLLNYNTSLAALEQQTGTILETHGLVFYEERFRAAGPLLCRDREYPSATPPSGTPELYPGTKSASENSFNLQNPSLINTSKGLQDLIKSNLHKLLP
ncbi:MAG TPA: TolC family protein [Gemmatales bacterium]|nr:TolC family protein [Gemmatales bacterium]